MEVKKAGRGPVLADCLDGPLVDRESGAVRVGAYAGAVAEANVEDARFPHALSALAGRPVVGRVEALYRRKLRLKTWQYMTLVSDRWFVAFAVASAGFAGDGRLDLGFRAVAHVDQTLRLPLLQHRLRHVGGSFRGRVVTGAGQSLDLDDAFGIAEDNDTWW